MNALEQTFTSLMNMDSGPALHLALKKTILNTYKEKIYLSLQPQMGGFIEETSVGISILNSQKEDDHFLLKCSVFYVEKIGGCNCNDEPHSENGYCELQMKLKEDEFLIL